MPVSDIFLFFLLSNVSHGSLAPYSINSVKTVQQSRKDREWEEGCSGMGGEWEGESPTLGWESGGKTMIL